MKFNKYFDILKNRLNNINNVNYDDTYWKQVFYLGLKRYIALVYEFYMQVSQRFVPEELNFRTLKKDSFYTPFDLEDLRKYLSNSEYAQEQLFSIYIDTFYQALENKDHIEGNTYKRTIPKVKVTWKNKVKLFLKKQLKWFSPKVLLLATHYDPKKLKELILTSKFKIIFLVFVPFDKITKIKKNVSARHELSNFQENFDDFDKFFFKTLDSLCPTALIEDFEELTSYYDQQVSRYKNLEYIVSEAWISDHQMSFFIAHLRQNGAKFVYSEHKGLQHPFINNFTYDLMDIADIYYTQGWYSKHYDSKSTLIQTGLLHKIEAEKNKIPELRNKILYMTAPAYAKRTNYNGINFFMGEDSECYFNFQKEFFSSLSERTLKNMIYRIAPISQTIDFLTYDSTLILSDYLKYMEIDDFTYTGLEATNSAKLVIIDYLGSGYLETLINNIPTILFLNTNCYLDESELNIFDDLIDVGIMQTNGKNAAKFLLSIEKDPFAWWMSNRVQNAREKFIYNVVGDGDLLTKELLKLVEKKIY